MKWKELFSQTKEHTEEMGTSVLKPEMTEVDPGEEAGVVPH